jgi:hypothetical protein
MLTKKGVITMIDKTKMGLIVLVISSFIVFSGIPLPSTTSLPPIFSITDQRIGINSYIVTFNDPDNATINISVANSATAHNFAINRTVSQSYNLTSNLIFLAYWDNIEIGSLILDYTSSIPAISVTSTQSENYVSISVSQLNVYTATISYKSQIIFSTLLTSPTTSFVYQTYPSVSYINISEDNFTLVSKAVLPPHIPQYSYKILVNPSLNSNNTYSISYYVNETSNLTLWSGNLLVFNKIINGSGILYISRNLNATAVVLYHDNSTAFITFLPLGLIQPEIKNIYHNSTVYHNNTVIQVEKVVNVEYVALSFIAGIVVVFAGIMIMKRRSKNE